MAELWQTLIYYFQFPLVQYALIVSLLIALCSSLLGVTLVLKRFSFIGDGLSHVAFGAMAISASLHTVITIDNDMIIVLPITVLSAILLLRTSQNAKIKGDALIAMISVGALAIGYLLMNLFSNSANISGDVCTTLFGATSILTLTISEVWLCAIMALLVIMIFILFYHKIFAVTFDENFAMATGVNANAYNLLIAIITALIIVLAMNLVGSLLISALIIFPSLSAMRIFKSFKSVIICSSIISVICAGMGIIFSILYATPAGATIVVADIAVFLLFSLVSGFTAKKKYS
ncbi:MAG: metal ABC transporter permease [Oscillospiraceae bacterium]|nr:metal ABC transporter permease [Oscillospiraceae bacterium]